MITLFVNPGYAAGHLFTWVVNPELSAPAPWRFQVEQGAAVDGPWVAISPVLVDQYAWRLPGSVAVGKDPVLFYRARLWAGGKEYVSPVRTPYGDVTRREFLLVQEIMRRELLQMTTLAGTLGALWVRAVLGPKCTICRDFVTGAVLRQDCPACFGTGFTPGYHGPYPVWMTFSPQQRAPVLANDNTEAKQPYAFQVRMLGSPPVKKDDVLVDTNTDKRYYADVVENVIEIRRIPAVMNVVANEIPVSSAIYKLGQA